MAVPKIGLEVKPLESKEEALPNIAKDISPDKITDMTYLNKPIVLGKQRGRPPQHGHYKPGYYPENIKVAAAVLYAATGNINDSSKLARVPSAQLRKWMGEEWWIDIQEQVHKEENARISSKMTELVTTTLEQMENRVKEGDPIINRSTGAVTKAPIKFRDLATGMNIVAEKRQLLRSKATSITERIGADQYLLELAAQFKKFAKAKEIPGEIIKNVQDIQTIETSNGGHPQSPTDVPETSQ